MRIKHSVAVLVRQKDRILSVRRPDDDDELPGIWGLPAGTCRKGESVEDLARRIGREKLGVRLVPLRVIRSGTQRRPNYVLNMDLMECSMQGQPGQPEWEWAPVSVLKDGAANGSLCCALALEGTL